MSRDEDPDPDSSGLLGIQLADDSDSESSTPTNNNSNNANDTNNDKSASASQPPAPVPRTAQSEAQFQDVRKNYRVKVENGEIWKTIPLPLLPPGRPVAKPEAQALLHAVEELYFFRRYEEGARFVRSVLGNNEDDGEGRDVGVGGGSGLGLGLLDADTRDLLIYYEGKCLEKLDRGKA
ncbi:hypothetical protein F4778DRAFT_723972 [Xylariomycetidae sp. FL2044]|nr:hypothetical protein F4778DRAFT_723972 [Xylariomycetidae sp. FL2044]